MWQENYNRELYHHGVKGMKWGVRRARPNSGTNNSRTSTKKSVNPIIAKIQKKKRAKQLAQRKEAAAKARLEASKKKPAELTEKELRERIARLELEKKYADLMKQTGQTKQDKGRKFVAEVLEKSAKNIATQAVTYAMGAAVNKAFESALNGESMVNPKKGQKDK